MPTHYSRIFLFWKELKRRKVIQVITVYAASAFVILELVDILAPSLRLPDWTLNLVLLLLCVGFVIAVIVSWIYDIHPEGGIVKTEPAEEVKAKDIPNSSNGWKIASYISFVVIVGLIVLNVIPRTGKKEILEKSIAVLPFENWSAGEEYAHMGDALANEIITELSKVRDFHVVSYTSSSRYKGPDRLSIPQIGIELGANYIIEGTVERQFNEVNIHVQVIKAKEDDHIWADEFSGRWEEIFRIQDDIALEVADQLMVVLTSEEKREIDEAPTGNPAAYDQYLRGLSYYETNLNSLTPDAISYFREAIRLDSTFALPWTYLSMCYWRQSENAASPEFHQAKSAAERALELAPNSGTALVNVAEILDNEYNFTGAEKKIKQALEVEPDNPYVQRNAGRFYTLLGRQDLSISFCKQALENDPTNPTALGYLIQAYFYAGQYANVWSNFEEYFRLGYSSSSAARLYYQLLLEEGQTERIINEPGFTNIKHAHYFGLAAVNFMSGNDTLAWLYCDSLRANLNGSINYYIAMANAYGGRTEEACIWLEKSFEIKEQRLTFLRVEPGFSNMRDNPRIKNILQKMNYPVQE